MNLLPLYVAIAAPTITLAATGSGATLPTATYFVRVVPRMIFGPGGPLPGVANSTGELHNVASAEASQAITLGQNLQVNIPFVGGVTHWDVYIGTATNTEIYCYTTPAAPNQAATVFTVSAPTPTGGALYSTVTASSVLPGNNFVAGGNQGALNTQIPNQAPPAVTPFIEGRNAVLVNPTGGSITIQYSPDGVTAMATYVVLTAAGTVGSTVDISNLGGFGKNLLVNGLGGLPKFLVASAAGAYLLGSP